jgi:hypothetical protein
MNYKARPLQGIVSVLLSPLPEKANAPIDVGAPRADDMVWQVGHAAFDATRALVLPFDPQNPLASRFGEEFHGKLSRKPWTSARPAFSDVASWWREILDASERTLDERDLATLLPAPIDFTAYSVSTLEEAYDYALYHSSFHLGRAHQIAGIP